MGGFGFVDCPDLRLQYNRDVWLHHEQLREFNVGDNVSFNMVLNKSGHPQAIELQASEGANSPVQFEIGDLDSPAGDAAMEQQRYDGTVKSFMPEKGFGFLDCPEIRDLYHSDVWVHHKQIKNFGVGDIVSFTMVLNA